MMQRMLWARLSCVIDTPFGREVEPLGYVGSAAHWYLVAWDLDRGAVRTFRVDRIEEAVKRMEPADALILTVASEIWPRVQGNTAAMASQTLEV